jgi:hypothetical protein
VVVLSHTGGAGAGAVGADAAAVGGLAAGAGAGGASAALPTTGKLAAAAGPVFAASAFCARRAR